MLQNLGTTLLKESLEGSDKHFKLLGGYVNVVISILVVQLRLEYSVMVHLNHDCAQFSSIFKPDELTIILMGLI